MNYTLKWSERAKDDMRPLGSAERKRIAKKVESHLVKDPIALGKPLTGNFSGLYSYRIGDYRVIYSIINDQLLIIILQVGHRKNVYEE